MKIPKKEDLIKISDYIWEIPKSFREDMRVPARIFASEKMLDELFKDRSLWQLVNMTTLPGVYKYALAMPDAHEGYGALVGGIMAIDIKDGIISPGAVGYDINCLPPESKISLPFGTYIEIKDILENKKVISISLKRKKLKISKIMLFLKRKENNYLLKITTKLGYTLKLTEDHPVLTINGMKEAKNLLIGEKVVIYPFQGIKYEKPKHIKIIDEKEFIEKVKQLGLNDKENTIFHLIEFLKKIHLLPLYIDSEEFSYLIKIFGYTLANGNIVLNKNKKISNLTIWGEKENLKLIKEDLEKIGIKSILKNNYLRVFCFPFLILLVVLGYPLENKNQKSISLLKFLKFSPLWQKRLFLASFFGAKLNSIRIHNKNKSGLVTLRLKIDKTKLKEAIKFFQEIKSLLKEFEIEVSKIKIFKNSEDEDKTISLNFQIKLNLNNLERFLNLINFEYHQEKRKLANLALAYLKYKKKEIENLRLKSKIFYSQNALAKVLLKNYQPELSEKSIWEIYAQSKIMKNSLKFDEFVKKYSFGNEGFIIDEIEKIEKENYQGYVYDLSLNDKDHNFIADNFVVSNCGVRLLVSPFFYDEIKDKIPKLTEEIYKQVPSGVGEGGFWKLNNDEMNKVLSEGAKWLFEIGYATKEDIEATESNGKLEGANPDKVSKNAKDRGRDQLGTIGAGNHFVEIQRVQEIFDEEIAKKLDLEKGKVCVLIHCGSRGLGHQVATDYIREALRYLDRKGVDLVDRELAYFDFNSPEGQDYFEAMKAAANFAFANRQLIVYEIRKAFKKVFGRDIELRQIYDVAHNIVKIEEYDKKKLLVHRKGATRSFPKNHPELVSRYKEIGQPTLIPGSMGTSSYVLIGQEKAMEISFGSSPHGAGRMMSRTEAKKKIKGSELKKELEARGISVAAGSMSGLAEEAPVAYKDVSEVVEVVHQIGIAKKIVKLVPIGVIKG
ncbi:MAG: RNA-splicing ligase RtcB [Patescibacteria group bacterium]